jgi:hypothetical protein
VGQALSPANALFHSFSPTRRGAPDSTFARPASLTAGSRPANRWAISSMPPARIQLQGDICIILKYLALVYPQSGNAQEAPLDEIGYQVVFTATPR